MQSAELFKQLMFHTDRYRTLELRDYIVITGLWPLAIGDFTANIRVHNQISTKNSGIFYWKWSKSLNVVKSDRVYLVTISHKRAVQTCITYLENDVQGYYMYNPNPYKKRIWVSAWLLLNDLFALKCFKYASNIIIDK